MKESVYKTSDDLPLFLNANLVAQVLGVSPSSGSCTNQASRYCVWAAAWWCPRNNSSDGSRSTRREVIADEPVSFLNSQ